VTVEELRQRKAEVEEELRQAKIDAVAWFVAFHFWTQGEWPTPEETWHTIANVRSGERVTLEEARQACIEACDDGEVYGLHTIVAMRHGEVRGDWRAPLRDEDPWRLALPVGIMQTFADDPKFVKAVAREVAA
jgi:hypothetical protein